MQCDRSNGSSAARLNICYLEPYQLGDYDFNRGRAHSVPSILLTNTTWWPCASRLAIALTKAGCAVSAIYPVKGHPLAVTNVISRSYPYYAIHPVNSLAQAIRIASPDLVVPCDDRAVQHLHELHCLQSGLGDHPVRQLIERSLGSPASYPVVSARYQLLKVASELELPVPDTQPAMAAQGLGSWAAHHDFPWVLKADGTWGGHGTIFVRDLKAGDAAVRQMSRPLSAGRAIKRSIVDRDPFWILPWRNHAAAQVIVQSRVEGYPANCAVLAWDGKLLAGIAVEVVCAQGETGSATIVRVVDNPGMMRAAEQLVARLGLSGFLGFDFVIESRTGTPYLIEMNPRVTPLCHLQLGPGRDMVSAIVAQLKQEPLVPISSTVPGRAIAYFPQAWHWNRGQDLAAADFHDVPWEEPLLVQELMRPPWPDRGLLARLTAKVRGLISVDTRAAGGFSRTPAFECATSPPPDPRKPPAVVPLRRNGTRTPLFLFHGADGQLGHLYDLTRHLDHDQPVYGILSQAILGQRVALTRVEQLAAFYLEQIQHVQPAGPYRLLGFSFGGYVAFEVARQLHSRGEAVEMLGMVDTLPMRAGMSPPERDATSEGNSKQGVAVTNRMAYHAKRMLRSGGLGYLQSKLRARGLRIVYTCLEATGLPIPAFLRSAEDISWFAAVRYVPKPFCGRIRLFQAGSADFRARASYALWSDLTSGNVEVLNVPGQHENIMDEPQVGYLAAEITNCLAGAQ